jgi:uncharacterized protein (TIGR02757 family)
MELSKAELKAFLDEKASLYESEKFIEEDPILIPHRYSRKEDVEIAGFMAATIAWGKRAMIIRNANKWMELMGNSPYDFVSSANEGQLTRLNDFVHRTFNGTDAIFFIHSLRNIYEKHGGLETVFSEGYQESSSLDTALIHFRKTFFEIDFPERSSKHIANIAKGSSAKRLCMYLRWMVRSPKRGVDLGLWGKIPSSTLKLPLDVHTGNVSRKLGLLNRKQDDWKAVTEISNSLREMDAEDPIKYDFALFGLGIYENF